jgi:hypothetical protein
MKVIIDDPLCPLPPDRAANSFEENLQIEVKEFKLPERV